MLELEESDEPPATAKPYLCLGPLLFNAGQRGHTCNLQLRVLHSGRLSRDISTSYGSIGMISNFHLTGVIIMW